MFLHIGSDVILPYREIVTILDAELLRHSPALRDLLALQELEKRVTDVSGGQPRSLVVADRGLYLSPISVLTLRRRGSLRLDEQLGLAGEPAEPAAGTAREATVRPVEPEAGAGGESGGAGGTTSRRRGRRPAGRRVDRRPRHGDGGNSPQT
ncbi:hypothetical protein Tmar_0005 [Thermaerobacter marianensis DSM 12885]|uniref:DUF370 domain-containing protein n=1 Tax=Thermaerobacter marianensis (strain ATCC 700841 / DSM 12885 / JCM 10246 / 7p75a) TaxID=644966 RepID=E6SK06_THEM7|nr:extracellular matrix/biofilm biosynthesis regulator RemA family protein [Thermaerobacter marianensis]ADU50130.1 hypothetical protein Tmar_0005 [Thermaerobacter marianensis DSM 12885]